MIPTGWRERIEHARRIQADAVARRATDPVGIVRWRPIHRFTPTLRLR